MAKKILVVDDSALMRRLACDIINSDERFHVEKIAHDGEEALKFLEKEHFDGVVLDVNMPKLDGLGLLKELHRKGIKARILMFSSLTDDGTKETLEALEHGAMDFIKKPENIVRADDDFKKQFISVLSVVTGVSHTSHTHGELKSVRTRSSSPIVGGEKLVAIASSTGGPKALQQVIPFLPANLNAPVLIVQHMPPVFTRSLAERLDSMSKIHVKEAEEGDIIQKGTVYLAAGGRHMKAGKIGGRMKIYYTDEPTREGVRPAANYMYESLMDSPYSEICCAVLTGMGADGTAGIKNLEQQKKIYVIAQDAPTSAVYGMPRAIAQTGLVNEILPLDKIAGAITKDVGVR
ncbi:MAG: chemotaxis-specific protein-glutamate methyltransferase CheB [Lachnospiraceae bacterium]|nr:chemotaxis-specific protein-glutamate methyltransferase CheB [Lachnospiraceae bacterium]